MISIVYVLLMHTAQSNWIATLEFTSEKKCIAAAAVIKSRIDDGQFIGLSQKPICVRIEK